MEVAGKTFGGTAVLLARLSKDVGRALKVITVSGGSGFLILMIIICSIFVPIAAGHPVLAAGSIEKYIERINLDFDNRLQEIRELHPHHHMETEDYRYTWSEFAGLAGIIAAKSGRNIEEFTYEEIRSIYEYMHSISYSLEEKIVTEPVEHMDYDGNISVIHEEKTETTLKIKISRTDIEKIYSRYSLSEDEILVFNLYRNEAFIYTEDATDLIHIARAELGNTGGEKYWRWYGFNRHAAWCACFVSWCLDRAGYIREGRAPKFALCLNGIRWFKDKGQYISGDNIPSPGMIIFYDRRKGNSLGQDGRTDHTGIVERVEGGYVYTIEGNWGNKVSKRKVSLSDRTILGYGVIR